MSMKNAELLRQAARMPVYMGNWLKSSDCGTVGCIAGNVCLLDGWSSANPREMISDCVEKGFEIELVPRVARTILGLAVNESDPLFHTSFWPEPFRTAYLQAEEGERPAIIQARVEAFIAEHGGDL